ncbi:hypothetical protein HK096_001837, partial [Nowakowskiella sp. JEL0078]
MQWYLESKDLFRYVEDVDFVSDLSDDDFDLSSSDDSDDEETVNVTTASMSTQDQKILEKELKAKLKIKTIRKKKREQRQKKLVQKGRSARTKSAGLIGECLSNQIQSALPVEVRSDGSELWKFL